MNTSNTEGSPQHSGVLLPYKGKTPALGSTVFVAPGAFVIGDVEIGDYSSIWFNSVVRGDVYHIRIGQRVNIQDLTMVHVTNNRCATIIEDDVTIGHRVVLHGCHVGHHCLIGMGAVVMDDAVIGDHALIGAGSVVTQGTKIPSGVLALGTPARPIRDLNDKELAELRASAKRYVSYASNYVESGVGVSTRAPHHSGADGVRKP